MAYRPGELHQNPDALSSLPLPSDADEPHGSADILMIEAIERPTLAAKNVAHLTLRDPLLSKVYQAVQSGSSKRLTEGQYATYGSRFNEMSTHKGCVLWGSRVVIRNEAQPAAMKLLHTDNPEATAMKRFARSHPW